MCFHCGLVAGSQASGCFVLFLAENIIWNTSVVILRSCFTCLNNTQCIRDVTEGTYSAQFYLISKDGQITHSPHKIINNIYISNTLISSASIEGIVSVTYSNIYKNCVYDNSE